MFEAVGVTFDMSTRRARGVQLSTLIALVAIAYYNFVSTCSPYYSTTYLSDCSPTLIPAGTEVVYHWFNMLTVTQIDAYDGSTPYDCVLSDVLIQEWLPSVLVPMLKIHMSMDCADNISVEVQDYTSRYWNENISVISGNATYFKNVETFGPGFPFDVVEYRSNWTTSYNYSRLFFGNSSIWIPLNDTSFDTSFFTMITDYALIDVQSQPIPNVQYLCTKCGAKADWKGQSYVNAWEFAYNTFNTVVSVYALLAFFWTMSLSSDLATLVKKIEREEAERIQVARTSDPEKDSMIRYEHND